MYHVVQEKYDVNFFAMIFFKYWSVFEIILVVL